MIMATGCIAGLLFFSTLLPALKASDSSAIAAWVQGIGSILAIFGTWYTTKTTTELSIQAQKNAQEESQKINRNLALILISKACDEIERIMGGIVEIPRCDLPHFRTGTLQSVMESLNVLEGKSLEQSLYPLVVECQIFLMESLEIVLSFNNPASNLKRIEDAIFQRNNAALLRAEIAKFGSK